MESYAAKAKLPLPPAAMRPAMPLTARLMAIKNKASDEAARADLAALPGHLERVDDIGRVARAGDHDEEVPGSRVGLELCRKYVLVTSVVCNGRNRLDVVGLAVPVMVPDAPLIELVGVLVVLRPVGDALALEFEELRLDRTGDCGYDLVLQVEQVGQTPRRLDEHAREIADV